MLFHECQVSVWRTNYSHLEINLDSMGEIKLFKSTFIHCFFINDSWMYRGITMQKTNSVAQHNTPFLFHFISIISQFMQNVLHNIFPLLLSSFLKFINGIPWKFKNIATVMFSLIAAPLLFLVVLHSVYSSTSIPSSIEEYSLRPLFYFQ